MCCLAFPLSGQLFQSTNKISQWSLPALDSTCAAQSGTPASIITGRDYQDLLKLTGRLRRVRSPANIITGRDYQDLLKLTGWLRRVIKANVIYDITFNELNTSNNHYIFFHYNFNGFISYLGLRHEFVDKWKSLYYFVYFIQLK